MFEVWEIKISDKIEARIPSLSKEYYRIFDDDFKYDLDKFLKNYYFRKTTQKRIKKLDYDLHWKL